VASSRPNGQPGEERERGTVRIVTLTVQVLGDHRMTSDPDRPLPASKQSMNGRILVKRPLAMRAIAAVAVAFTAWHVFASYLWIAPPTPLRELVPGTLLTQYMMPWYGQSWSVFAPEPINGDYRLKVRAVIEDGDTEHTTKWVDATAVEQSMVTHNPFPPRAGGLALHQASLLKGTWAVLSDEQKRIASLNYYVGDAWLGRMQVEMNASATDSNKAAVVNYIVQERFTDAYATQVAKAVWGDKVVRVQYEVSRQNIVPFAERNNPNAHRPDPQIVPTGWRGLITLESQSSRDFSDTFLSHYKGGAK
jgi:hypothetical protein